MLRKLGNIGHAAEKSLKSHHTKKTQKRSDHQHWVLKQKNQTEKKNKMIKEQKDKW